MEICSTVRIEKAENGNRLHTSSLKKKKMRRLSDHTIKNKFDLQRVLLSRMCASLTFMSVGHEDAGHEFLLAVVTEGVPDHDLLLCQLTLKVQSVPPVE